MHFAAKLRKKQIKPKTKTEQDLVLILDNVYDTFNVGGMYRVGDASNVAKIYHGDQTPFVPDAKITRAAVGLDKYIDKEKTKDIVGLIKHLKTQGYQIVVLEQAANSQEYDCVQYRPKVALIVGNETFGVRKEIIELADMVVELPMYGINQSLNVVVATGIVLYQIRKVLLSA